MSYRSTVKMAVSTSLRERMVAAAAQEGVDHPEQWVQDNLWPLVTSPGWEGDWAYAEDTYTDDKNPDTGARPDVISDAKILSAVQARRIELGETQPAPAAAAAPEQEPQEPEQSREPQ